MALHLNLHTQYGLVLKTAPLFCSSYAILLLCGHSELCYLMSNYGYDACLVHFRLFTISFHKKTDWFRLRILKDFKTFLGGLLGF